MTVKSSAFFLFCVAIVTGKTIILDVEPTVFDYNVTMRWESINSENQFRIDSSTVPFPVNSSEFHSAKDLVLLPAGQYEILSSSGDFDGNNCNHTFSLITQNPPGISKNWGGVLAVLKKEVGSWHESCGLSKEFDVKYDVGQKQFVLDQDTWVRPGTSRHGEPADNTMYGTFAEITIKVISPTSETTFSPTNSPTTPAGSSCESSSDCADDQDCECHDPSVVERVRELLFAQFTCDGVCVQYE